MGYLTVPDPQEGDWTVPGTEPCCLEQQQQRQPYTTGKAQSGAGKEDESLPGIG